MSPGRPVRYVVGLDKRQANATHPPIPYGPGKTPLMLALSRMSPFLPAAIIA
jgi:hypothetical protein